MALQCDIQLPISAVKDFRFLIQQSIAEARKVRIQAANYDFIVSCCNKTRSLDPKHPYKEKNNNNNNNNNNNRSNNYNNNNNSRTPSGPSNSRPPCKICGMSNHATPECRTKQSEFANHSDHPFIESESHKRLVNLIGKRDTELQELRRLHSESSSSSSSTYAPKKPFVKKD